jgi:hypothetical protein
MRCAERIGVKRLYESALWHWPLLSMLALDGGTTSVVQVRRKPEGRDAARRRLRGHMLTVVPGRRKVFRVVLASIGLLALVALSIAVGVHAFLAAVGHYAPWEQIWTG